MKNSGVEWIGEIPDDWEVKPVKRYFSHVKRIVGDDVDKYERLSLTMQGVLKRSKDDAEGLQPEKFNGYQILKQNELVFKLIDLENVNTSRVGISPFNGLVSPAYIILSNNKKDNTFYYYWFLNMYYQEIFNKLGDGGVRSALNASDVLSLPMVYLNNETQQRIASYLDKKCSKIEETIQNQQQVIEKLKAYKQSLITEAVTGKIKIQNGKVCGKYESYKESGVEWIGKIPSEWNCPKIKYLHKGLTDGTHGTYNRLSNGYLLLSSKNVRDNYIEISDNESFISEEDFKEITANGFPQKGDVLLCCIGASIGRCTIYDLDETVAFQRSVIMIRCNEKIVPKFLMYALKSSYVLEQENVLINQSAQAGLYQGLVSKIYITISSVSEQKEIADYLDKKCTAIDTAIEQKQNLIEKLTEYKKSLIYECVTGKKEI